MDKASDILTEITSITLELYKYMTTQRLDMSNKVTSYIKQVNPLTIKLSNTLSKQHINIKDFVQENRFNIWKIHDVLYGTYSKTFLSNVSTSYMNDLRKTHDKLIKSTLEITQPKRRFGRLASEVVRDFCKGITYFLKEADDLHPFYHRPGSCGSALLTAQEKFAIINTNTQLTKQAKKQYVKNCYIERNIFDAIYQHIYKQQNVAHLNELKLMESLYLEYHRDIPIIHLNFSEDYLMPKSVTIIYNEVPQTRIEETYTKLHDQIHAKKLAIITHPTFIVERYEKIQHTEASDQPWLKIESHV